MMTIDVPPAIYQTADYRSEMGNAVGKYGGSHAISSSEVFSMKRIQPAVLIRTINSADEVNVSSDSALIAESADYETKSQFKQAQSFWKSVTVWQRMSELVAAGAFLVTCALIVPGIGRNDR